MRTTVCRKAHFNAAHRLYNPKWSAEKNDAVFGKCANPYFHGHNFDLIVKVRGEVNQDTGFVMDMSDLATLIQQEIEARFDHKNLNQDCPEFKELLPSTENFAFVIYNILRPKINPEFELGIQLYETEKNFVELGDW